MGETISNNQTYAAFISYAHADERAARRLHEALENYDLPDGVLVNGRESFSPIFRDVTELTAAHSLSEKIRQALEQSSFLIVLCSPAARDSHWVNEEIRLFRSLHGDRAILSAIVEGTPSTSFPPALLEAGHEPLAANLKQGRDSFRFGVHQLAASILGVGLDTLVQRGERKRRLRTQLMTVAASGLAVVMGGLWFNAQSAQKQAEKSRDDAERLVEYMVSDLKSELYSLQRLDILDGLGEEIVEYYEGIDPERLSDDRLVKLITALQTLAEVSNLERNFDRSERYLTDASRLIDVMEKRNPEGDDSLFYRAQNEFWMGQIFYKQFQHQYSEPHWQSYKNLSYKLYERDPENIKWIMEAGWGEHNIGLIYNDLGKYETASGFFERAVQIFGTAYEKRPNDIYIGYEFANILAAYASSEVERGHNKKTISLRKQAMRVYDKILKNDKDHYKALYYRSQTQERLLKVQGVSRCSAIEYEPIRETMQMLISHEPRNTEWLTEYYSLWVWQIEDCKKYHSEARINEMISAFRISLRGTSDSEVKKRMENLLKLRVIDPEP